MIPGGNITRYPQIASNTSPLGGISLHRCLHHHDSLVSRFVQLFGVAHNTDKLESCASRAKCAIPRASLCEVRVGGAPAVNIFDNFLTCVYRELKDLQCNLVFPAREASTSKNPSESSSYASIAASTKVHRLAAQDSQTSQQAKAPTRLNPGRQQKNCNSKEKVATGSRS